MYILENVIYNIYNIYIYKIYIYIYTYIYIYIGAIDAKEFFEAVEFYARVRKRVRRPVMLDLACGHGLVGELYAV